MAYVFEPAPVVAIPVFGTDDLFAVRRIYCVGRNYTMHAREMGHDPLHESPLIFCKPADSIRFVTPGTVGEFPYPTQSNDVHYEMELVAVIGKRGKSIAEADALDHVFGYALGLDMTRRDLLRQMQKVGRPWDLGKAFDASAPIGPIHPVARTGHIREGAIWLNVNREKKQSSNLSQMMWTVPRTISHISKYFELYPGDLIYTGTPEGVGPIEKGDTMHGGIEGLGEFVVKVI